MSTAAPSPQLLQRVAEKKQELEHLLVLRQLANHLETHFDGLSEKFDGLTQGNQGTGHHTRLHTHRDTQDFRRWSWLPGHEQQRSTRH